MSKQDHLGFKIRLSEITSNTFIPKFYNPEIQDRLQELSLTHELVSLGQLLQDGHISVSSGHEVGKMAYGTGAIPFVRTSDISNWEIKADPKQGVSTSVYDKYAAQQDLKAGDIFLVRDGTYLIGQSCVVTSHDLPCLYQSHILKFRVNDSSPFDTHLLFAALNSSIVKRQIRSVQFTADIIDTIGNRYTGVILPLPKEEPVAERITSQTRRVVEERTALRECIKRIPLEAQGISGNSAIDAKLGTSVLMEESDSSLGFKLSTNDIRNSILMPKYYNPQLEDDLTALATTHKLVSLAELVHEGIIGWETGIEVGKMAYGTGPMPFIRTSDISNWELKADPKQSVSEIIYEANKQDVRSEDIFLVRDGTYLVGTSAIVTARDEKVLFSGGIYKLRVLNRAKLNPYLFLALLNTPIVRRQMRAKQFTRDIIDTLGKRLFEVAIPIPKDQVLRLKLTRETQGVIEKRTQLLGLTKRMAAEVEGISTPQEDNLQLVQEKQFSNSGCHGA